MKSNAIDVGSNIGNHAIYFSRYFEKVFAIEPSKIAYKILKLNIQMNNIKNIVTKNIALSSNHSIKKFNDSHKYNLSVSSTSFIKNKTQLIRLETFKGDDVFANIKNIGLIKLDIEGHEYDAILGMKKIIAKNMPIILFEANKESKYTNSTFGLLNKMGYSFWAIEDERLPAMNRLLKFLYCIIFGWRVFLYKIELPNLESHRLVISLPHNGNL